MIAAALWLFFCAAFIVTCHIIGRRNARRTNEPVALHVPAETVEDAEWRRRIKRWADEQDAS